MPTPADHEKRAMRAELRERRQNLTANEREQATIGLTNNLVALVTGLDARSVSCYLSAPNEPDTRPFLNWALANDIRVLFPVTREDGLLDWTVGSADGDVEQQGMFGMPEPVGEALGPIAINDVDLILVPAAAISPDGTRLGWGRGYYDKTLGSMEKCPPAYAVVYDHEVLDSIPREIHDQPVNGVVTPSRVFDF